MMKQSSFDDDELANETEGLKAVEGTVGVSEVPRPPPRAKRTGGWSDDKPVNKHVAENDRSLENKTELDSEDELLIIPDLNDVQEEDLAMQVAQAPNISVNRVATYKELDNDLFRHSAFTTLDNLNLRILTKNLAPESDVKEIDCMWSWDLLMTEISSQINDEYGTV